jgi:hypothetical protein
MAAAGLACAERSGPARVHDRAHAGQTLPTGWPGERRRPASTRGTAAGCTGKAGRRACWSGADQRPADGRGA